jgi:hypothetical protein
MKFTLTNITGFPGERTKRRRTGLSSNQSFGAYARFPDSQHVQRVNSKAHNWMTHAEENK